MAGHNVRLDNIALRGKSSVFSLSLPLKKKHVMEPGCIFRGLAHARLLFIIHHVLVNKTTS